MFAAGCTVPPRQVHEIEARGALVLTSLIMPAWLEGRYYGVKTINIAAANAARGLPGLHASYILYDATTGVPLALIDGNELTARRTAAASALAAGWLALRDARRLLVIGTGRVAQCLPDAYRAVRPIEHVAVWARTTEPALRMVARLRARGIAARAVPDLEQAVGEADIVSCATPARAPVVHGQWLRPGSHLDLIGSFTPDMREADDDCFAGATVYVDTEEALTKSGDVLAPIARGVWRVADLGGTLTTLARAQAAGRRSDTERTVFKSVGTALEDLCAAILVFEAQGCAP
jgi:ornithine cyclodeaminase